MDKKSFGIFPAINRQCYTREDMDMVSKRKSPEKIDAFLTAVQFNAKKTKKKKKTNHVEATIYIMEQNFESKFWREKDLVKTRLKAPTTIKPNRRRMLSMTG